MPKRTISERLAVRSSEYLFAGLIWYWLAVWHDYDL